MVYLIHCKDLCKCHNVPPPSTTIKGKKSGASGPSLGALFLEEINIVFTSPWLDFIGMGY
jgi:hypothetical protein